VLGSRLHWLLSTGLMLVTVTGRRSGRTYTIPVGYHDVGDAVVVMVSDAANRQWWRNFRTPAPARLRLRGRSIAVEGTAPPPDSPEFVRRAEQAFRRARFVGRIFGIEFDAAVGLTAAQRETLAGYARVVVFRRTNGVEGAGKAAS
jgi:hypothetical protein